MLGVVYGTSGVYGPTSGWPDARRNEVTHKNVSFMSCFTMLSVSALYSFEQSGSLWIRRYVEKNWGGLMKVLSRNFSGGPEVNKNSSVRISGRSTEIWSELLPNTNVEHYRKTSLLVKGKSYLQYNIRSMSSFLVYILKKFSPLSCEFRKEFKLN
jgi:hypothetical protein